MTGGAETPDAAGKVEKEFSTKIRAADPSEPAARVAALETLLILRQKPVEIMEEDPVESVGFWMSGTIDSYDGKQENS
jgi:hypothetical protein